MVLSVISSQRSCLYLQSYFCLSPAGKRKQRYYNQWINRWDIQITVSHSWGAMVIKCRQGGGSPDCYLVRISVGMKWNLLLKTESRQLQHVPVRWGSEVGLKVHMTISEENNEIISRQYEVLKNLMCYIFWSTEYSDVLKIWCSDTLPCW